MELLTNCNKTLSKISLKNFLQTVYLTELKDCTPIFTVALGRISILCNFPSPTSSTVVGYIDKIICTLIASHLEIQLVRRL